MACVPKLKGQAPGLKQVSGADEVIRLHLVLGPSVASCLTSDTKRIRSINLCSTIINGCHLRYFRVLFYIRSIVFTIAEDCKAMNTSEKEILSLLKAGNTQTASQKADLLLTSHPNSSLGLFARANHCVAKQNYDRAIKDLLKATKLDPNNPSIHNLLGVAFKSTGKQLKALHHYKLAYRLAPSNPDIANNYFRHLFDSQPDQAIKHQIELSKIHSRNPKIFANLGYMYSIQELHDHALSAFSTQSLLEPNNPEPIRNTAKIYFSKKNYGKAESVFRALWIKHKSIDDALELAKLLKFKGDYTGSTALLEEIIKVDPKKAEAAYELALIRFSQHRIKEGFKLYPSRFFRPQANSHWINSTKPLWNENADGTVYIWGEQGVGDQIFFSRFFSSLSEQAHRQIICSIDKRLIEILNIEFPEIRFVEKADGVHIDFDSHLPLGNLPNVIKIDDKFVQENPSALLKAFCPRNQTSPGAQKRVGLSWFSKNAAHEEKSIPVSSFANLVSGVEADFVCMQYNPNVAGLTKLQNLINSPIATVSTDIYASINALFNEMSQLDALITSSNVNAHVAGALGIPTLLLVPLERGRFWYWYQTTQRNYSIWYPSIKVVTQTRDGDWDSVSPNIIDSFIKEL
jgi:tetratricopeptide (TPR) repeat protein